MMFDMFKKTEKEVEVRVKRKSEPKELDLFIGKVSISTLKNNFSMIENEYARLLDEDCYQYTVLNEAIMYKVKEAVLKEHCSKEAQDYRSCTRNYEYSWHTVNAATKKKIQKALELATRKVQPILDAFQYPSIAEEEFNALTDVDNIKKELADLTDKYKYKK